MAGRPIFALISLIFVAGGLVLHLFVTLSGGVSGAPINKFWFLETTNPVSSSPPRIAYTFFSRCAFHGDTTYNCLSAQAGPIFNPWGNYGVSRNVPSPFQGSYYYNMSKSFFAFFIVALFFAAISFFTGLLALCTRIGGFLSGAAILVAAGLQIVAASLMTAEFVQGRDDLRNNGQDAHIGKYSFGFSWAAMACYFIAGILFCISGKSSSSSSGVKRNKSTRSRDGIKSDYS